MPVPISNYERKGEMHERKGRQGGEKEEVGTVQDECDRPKRQENSREENLARIEAARLGEDARHHEGFEDDEEDEEEEGGEDGEVGEGGEEEEDGQDDISEGDNADYHEAAAIARDRNAAVRAAAAEAARPLDLSQSGGTDSAPSAPSVTVQTCNHCHHCRGNGQVSGKNILFCDNKSLIETVNIFYLFIYL